MLLGATLLSTAGVATAQTPVGWSIHVVPLPDKVTPGADAGYRVTISNTGPSNISQVYLLNDPAKGNPTYVDDSIATGGRLACTGLGVQLLCSFGALNAGETVTVIVGYNTSGFASPFDPVLETTSNGVSFQDPKRSHGDALTDPTGVTTLVTNQNFGGGFNGSVGNSDQLNGQNKQSEKITHLPGGIGATVQDGTDTTGTCTPVPGVLDCKSFAGEWTLLNVNNGASVGPPGYFILQVHFKSGTPTVFVHSASANYLQEVIQLCTASAFDGGNFVGTTPCYTWDALTSIATIYLFHNSPVRG
jgi:hypothetical protein